MPFGPGVRLGPYEVIAAIGAGGMGEVYRARDTKLNRDVALKILPATFASDPDRLARFHREAQVLASLNHPHIGAIYGFEESGETHALVLEFVDGPTLADRIAQGPIPTDEALPIAIQIAEALEAAHEQGIIHRDLKPANIKLRPDGTVKVLDFGLAKLTEAGGASEAGRAGGSFSLSPTITSPALMTGVGVLLGTAAYMSPEQAKGRPADKRSDIWAFGCILFEMLTGKRPFGGEDVTETIAGIVKSDPDWGSLPDSTPLPIGRVVRRCLEKDLRRRMRDVADARVEIEDVLASPSGEGTPAPIDRSVVRLLGMVAATIIVAAAAGAVMAWRLVDREPRELRPVTRFVAAEPEDVAPRGAGVGRHVVAISPQGTHLVYWAKNQLYLRALDQLGDAKPMAGTEGAREPFFSADGQWIGFFQGDLKKVSIRGGAVIRLADATNPYGVSWGGDDEVLYGAGRNGIWRVAGTGGAPAKVVTVNEGEEAHGPQRLPDGSILFTLLPKGETSWDNADIVVQERDGTRTNVVHGGRDARYLSTGHLIYGVNGTLYAAAFDASAHVLRKGAIPVVERVMDADLRTGAMHYSVSAEGTLTYVVGPSGQASVLLFLDRGGRPDALPQQPVEYARPRMSPDRTRVAVEVGPRNNRTVFVYDLRRYTLTRLTPPQLRDARFALWTRDSKRIVFFADAADAGGLFSIAADGTGQPTQLTSSTSEQRPYAWSSDNRTLVFEQGTTGVLNTRGIYLLSIDADRTPTPLLPPMGQGEPALSPDGKWLAYASLPDSAGSGVYVQPFPDVNKGRWLIASAAYAPIWSPDGRELYFISGGRAMAVTIVTAPSFNAGTPRTLFDLGPYYRGGEGLGTRQWDIDPNGSRFITLKPGDNVPANADSVKPQLVVVRNWTEELKQIVPAK